MERRSNRSRHCETVQVLLEFLEVAVTSVVFLKSVYPADAFERRRYMGIIVPRARHPGLRDYIHTSISSLRPFVEKVIISWAMGPCHYDDFTHLPASMILLFVELVERVTVIFFNNENIPVEKFVFKLSLNLSHRLEVEEVDFEFSLRSFLMKLSLAKSLTTTLPTDCRWEITAYFRSLPDYSSKEAPIWIPTDTKLWQQPPTITPIKSMSSEPLSVQLYLEHPGPSEPAGPTGPNSFIHSRPPSRFKRGGLCVIPTNMNLKYESGLQGTQGSKV